MDCCYVDYNGIGIQCEFHEACDEFNGEVPDWEKRLKESDEFGMYVENEIDGWGHGLPTISDWNAYFEMTYADPNEREEMYGTFVTSDVYKGRTEKRVSLTGQGTNDEAYRLALYVTGETDTSLFGHHIRRVENSDGEPVTVVTLHTD